MSEKVYKNPAMKDGNPLISSISTGCKTPILSVKYCNIRRPFYYPNSPGVPRYSVTCVLDPVENKEFISNIQKIEKQEGVDTILKVERVREGDDESETKNVLIKFQSKDIVPVYVLGEDGNPSQIKLEDDFARGEKISVVYDIVRYTKKGLKLEHGLSFKVSCIYYYPSNSIEGAK